MNAECQMQWNRLTKEAGGDFPLEKLEGELQTYLRENPDDGERTARTTLRSIREALRCREHEDDAVRHKAGKLIKSCRHSFDGVCKNADHFRKALTEARERRADAETAPGIIPLSGEFRLEEVASIKKLITIGKTLELCVGKREDAQRYWEQAEAGEFKFLLLLKEEKPFALLKIDVNENEEVVGQFSAHNNDDPKISFELAMKILHELGVTADDVTSFTRVGAYGRFKGGRPEVEPVRVGEQEMWIWLYEDELIVAMEEHSDGKLFWSHFQLTRTGTKPWNDDSMNQLEWDDHFSNYLSMGMFFEIVRRNPHILEKLRSPIMAESPHLKIVA
ncbi:MAG: hypothetical protein OXL41_02740 [Nitrospinae bacterium]|nr:hypothetical protein [Nitrospinota bacterium]